MIHSLQQKKISTDEIALLIQNYEFLENVKQTFVQD